MSKRYIIISMLCIMFFILLIFYPSNDDSIIINNNFTLEDATIETNISYKNEKLEFFRPSPENRYKCIIDYSIKSTIFEQTKKFNLLSNDDPIYIDDLLMVNQYEDENIIMFTVYIKYKENIVDLQSYILLKQINEMFEFDNIYTDLIEKLQSRGLSMYDEEKIKKIADENRDKWDTER